MTPIGLYDYVFKWTDSLTEGDCIVCFNSTDMESEVLKALLVAKVPTILFVMNRFTDVNNIQIERALKENRMLMIVLKRDEPIGKGATPRLRNEYVISLCQHIVCGYINKNGSVFPLLAGRKNVVNLIDDNANSKAAEPIVRHERWTVAQDKMLLRMFYDDMGIHAMRMINYLLLYIMKTEAQKNLCLYSSVMRALSIRESINWLVRPMERNSIIKDSITEDFADHFEIIDSLDMGRFHK